VHSAVRASPRPRFRRWRFGIGALVLAAVVTPAIASSVAESAARQPTVAVQDPPTASRLLAKVKTCSQISNGRYSTDDGGPRIIPVCGRVSGAVFWKADMDIDCDGVLTARCNTNTDPSFLPGTALEPGGRPLNAETTRYMVIPQGTGTFNYGKHNIKLGAVVAIVYEKRVTFAVFGDTGPKNIIGEASYATAKTLGIDPDPATGGADSGVTYIVFKGTKVANPHSNSSIARAGKAAAVRFLGGN
jgi:hypothetical protein